MGRSKTPRSIEPSREAAYAKMLDAGLRILSDLSRSEIEAWANKTTEDYIQRGIIRIESAP